MPPGTTRRARVRRAASKGRELDSIWNSLPSGPEASIASIGCARHDQLHRPQNPELPRRAAGLAGARRAAVAAIAGATLATPGGGGDGAVGGRDPDPLFSALQRRRHEPSREPGARGRAVLAALLLR